MSRRGIALMEIIIYTFIMSFIGIYMIILAMQYLENVRYNKQVMSFSNHYNNLLKTFYSRAYEGRDLTGNATFDKLYIYNSGAYIGYGCEQSGFAITYSATGLAQIDWENPNHVFTGFVCTSISGWSNNSGYWLSLSLGIIDKDYNYKYYFNNGQN